MKKIVINENQKGILFKNGKFKKLLGAGKYRFIGDVKLEINDASEAVWSNYCGIDALLENKEIAEKVTVCEVGDNEVCLHFVNGKYREAFTVGKYAFWNERDRHEFRVYDMSEVEISDEIPGHIISRLPFNLYEKVNVPQYFKCRLYFDGRFVRLLESGTYFFWKTDVRVTHELVDTRLTSFDINGQEMLTCDKVTVRVNFVCNYRITDFVKVACETDDYKQQLYIKCQLALREYVGKCTIDGLLENKDEMSRYVLEKLKACEKALYVEISDAGVKDIILPGEIRDIMNTVLIAEKKAQANVIARREEVASTRSLLNTAKLMDENKTLYKLKELEYLERICENVGSINLSSGGDVLSQLARLVSQ